MDSLVWSPFTMGVPLQLESLVWSSRQLTKPDLLSLPLYNCTQLCTKWWGSPLWLLWGCTSPRFPTCHLNIHASQPVCLLPGPACWSLLSLVLAPKHPKAHPSCSCCQCADTSGPLQSYYEMNHVFPFA